MNKNSVGWVKIKLKILIGLLAIILFISSFSAFADAPFATTGIEITENEITIDVDYEKFNDDNQDTISVLTNQITVKNNNPTEVKILLDVSNLPSDYSSESQELTIAGNASVNANLNLNVPHEEEPGNSTIGDVVVLGEGNVELDKATLTQETKSMLEMTHIKVKYYIEAENEESDSFDSDTEDSFELDEKVQVYSEITLEIKIKNLLDDKYDVDIDNVKLTIEADDNDLFESGFDEEYELDNLKGEEKIEETITFMIDEEADVKEYTLELTLEGEDEEGIEYKLKKEITFELESKKDDIRILNVETVPEEITLCESQVTYSVSLKNLGHKDQKYVALSIFNEELKINENIQTINLEEHGDEDSWDKEFTLNLKNVKAKDYDLDITTYVDNDEPVDYERFKLVIGKCIKETVEKVEVKEVSKEEEIVESVTEVIVSNLDTEQNNKETVTTTTSTNQEGDLISSSAVVETVEDSYSKEDFIVGVMLVAIVMILILIIVFFVVLLK
ncbi:hypothetical protein HOE37_02030 [Candidatus Woesearchaeota archaeon]|jgi:hypothetical protein|nr:hypothetical protein [Candidatus Woesearchaeota archaeon]MBT4110613.1 hypothetical protein [Candidatus Woesearchaeota archaeon]MBT4335863.1 hypothetical protein [Candidatus Woesearchaeota archaeon]MBT4469158.1 hypothetical protein [Candidatus Woesearchaeota archaeon]MBT6744523.1 hypothetical protein [Candidatus Woesearchaeota archaeon]